jgi:hypothetical protein
VNITEITRHIAIGVGLSAFLVWKTIIKTRNDPDSSVSRRVAISTLGLMIALISAGFRPVNFTYHILGIVFVQQGLLFGYIVADNIYGSKEYYHFWKNKKYIIYTLASFVVVILDFIRRHDNFGSFLDKDDYKPSLIYYSSYIIHYGISILIIRSIIKIDEKDLKDRKIDVLPYKIRRYTSLYGFKFAYIAMAIILFNVSLSILIGDKYRQNINNIYQIIRLIFVTLLILGLSGHEKLFKLIAYPIEKYKSIRQEKKKDLLIRFHQSINGIVDAHLPNPSLSSHRIIYEISDVRDKVLSHFSINKPDPALEAEIFYNVINNTQGFESVGPYKVIQIPSDYEEDYYTQVAKYFKQKMEMN